MQQAFWWGKPPLYLILLSSCLTPLQGFVYGINGQQPPYLLGTVFEHGRAEFG
jgi:hypothetical protein